MNFQEVAAIARGRRLRWAIALLLVAASLQIVNRAEGRELVDVVGPIPPPGATVPPPPSPAATPGPSSIVGINWPGRLRVEGGVGYTNGGTDTTISSPGLGSVSTNMLSGGGLAAEAALWSDSFPLQSISVGAQYLHFDQSSSISASSSAGPILGLTSASASIGLATNAMMFDLAWRPDIQRFHPYIGTGVGVAFTELTGSAVGFSASDSRTAVAGQAFLGFDYDVTPNMYVGLTGRFFISDATYHATSLQTPSGATVPVLVTNSIDVTNRPISLAAHVGVQF